MVKQTLYKLINEIKQDPAVLISSLYSVLLILVFPFVYHHSYLDILETKTTFYLCITVPLVILMVLILAKQGRLKKSIPIFPVLFLIGLFVSMIMSGNIAASWTGVNVKMMGVRIWLLCIMVSLCISRIYVPSQLWKMLISGSGILVGLLIIFNRFGTDPLQMYPLIADSQYDEFLGTIGQINIVAGYCCLIFPMAAGLLLTEKDPIKRWIHAAATITSCMAGICSNSDSFLVGMAVTCIVLLFLCLHDGKDLLSYGFILLSIGISVLLLRTTYIIKGPDLIFRDLQHRLIISSAFLVTDLVLAISCIIIGKKCKVKKSKKQTDGNLPNVADDEKQADGNQLNQAENKKQADGNLANQTEDNCEKAGPLKKNQSKSISKAQKIYLLLLLLAAFISMIALIYINAYMKNTSTISPYLLLDETWGTNRMYVWQHSLMEYAKLPLLKKLFGVGAGNFSSLLVDYYGEELYLFGYYFVDAHNELIQCLVEFGIVGCIGYLGMLLHAIYVCAKDQKNTRGSFKAVIMTMLIVWIFQGIFNNPTIFVTPIIFYFIGIAESKL